MKNMTLAFLACMTLTAPAMAESTIVDRTAAHHHLNTKDVFHANKTQATPAAMPMAPMVATANADADFAFNMIAHHQSGVDMAKVELEKGKDPEMKKLAQNIIDSQGKEIAQMQAWLAKHKK